MPDVRGRLLPIYVVVDESASMAPYVGEMNAGLESLHEALLGEPMAAAKVRISIIGFSNDAVPRLHLADLRRQNSMPAVTSRGQTNFGRVFEYLIERIPADITELKAEQYAVFRPAVFFLSDGQPTDGDGWVHVHGRLVDRQQTRAAPNVIACGIGDARPETILRVATRPEYAFVAIAGIDVGPAIADFTTALTRSVVQSGRSLGSNAPELVVEKPEGFRMAIDVV